MSWSSYYFTSDYLFYTCHASSFYKCQPYSQPVAFWYSCNYVHSIQDDIKYMLVALILVCLCIVQPVLGYQKHLLEMPKKCPIICGLHAHKLKIDKFSHFSEGAMIVAV